jgi:hypothetical protein
MNSYNGQTHAEYMRKYRKTAEQKRRVNRENTLEALRGAEKALIEITHLGPMKIAKPTLTALTGVRRAMQVLEDGIKL